MELDEIQLLNVIESVAFTYDIEFEYSDDTREFIQRKINEMNLDDLRDYELPPSFYLIKIDGTDIKIQLIYCILVRTNEYRV